MIQKANIDLAYKADEEINCLSKDAYRPLHKAINQVLKPTSVADLGCRVGHLITLFKEEDKLDVMGVDYFDWNKEAASDSIKNNFLVGDLRDPLILDRKYNLVVSTEVGEHIDAAYSTMYLQNIRHAMEKDGKLLMTWAPGSPNDQHLNPLEREDFFSFMVDNGFILNKVLTENIIKASADFGLFNTFHWYYTGNMSVWQLKQN